MARDGVDAMFRERVEGVHLELVDLLLERAAVAVDAGRARRDLERAQRTVERFKADELRDYFRDDCVDAYRQKIVDPASASPSATVIYPIALPERLELLVSSPGDIRQFTVPVSQAMLTETVRDLRRLLTKRSTRQFMTPARQLHRWLIAPIEGYVQELGVDTLVFVPGGAPRTIPMAALPDG
jgi:CHAT domain-containing protein